MWACDGRMVHRMVGCALAAAFCALFSTVYQLFGHGVTSLCMSLAFLPPFVGGGLQLGLWTWRRGGQPLTGGNLAWQDVLFCGLATLCAGMYLQGIVEIAGVDCGWENAFYLVGAVLTLGGSIGLWHRKGGQG